MQAIRSISLMLAIVLLTASLVSPGAAQNVPWNPLKRGSDNMEVLGHLPLGPRLSVADMDLSLIHI